MQNTVFPSFLLINKIFTAQADISGVIILLFCLLENSFWTTFRINMRGVCIFRFSGDSSNILNSLDTGISLVASHRETQELFPIGGMSILAFHFTAGVYERVVWQLFGQAGNPHS